MLIIIQLKTITFSNNLGMCTKILDSFTSKFIYNLEEMLFIPNIIHRYFKSLKKGTNFMHI